jgi:hypothetical protein
MTNDHDLYERGYHAILSALEGGDEALNVDVLAQACARKARACTTEVESLGWAEAAIACYARAAERRTWGYDRQGSEAPAFGLMVDRICKWGPEIGSEVSDPARVAAWIQEAIDVVGDVEAFRASDSEAAFCLRERLMVGKPLFEQGLLPTSMDVWFRQGPA